MTGGNNQAQGPRWERRKGIPCVWLTTGGANEERSVPGTSARHAPEEPLVPLARDTLCRGQISPFDEFESTGYANNID